jgi:small subunit ribosomal protein S17
MKDKKLFVGEVISDKMDKTVVVKYLRAFKHPQFHKIVHVSKKYKVHDAEEIARIGDTIEFFEGAPVSKTKFMYLHRVIK